MGTGCGDCWRAPVQVTGFLAAIVVASGALVCAWQLPPVIDQLENLGEGANWVRGLSRGSYANTTIAVIVSVLALIPLMFAQDSCRKRWFGDIESEGCCASIKVCFQTILGVYVVGLIELVLFLSVIWTLGVTYIYGLSMAIMFLSSSVCTNTDSQEALATLVLGINNTNITTMVGDFVANLNVTGYCESYDASVFGNARLVFATGVCVLMALIFSFMAVGRSKECIANELREPDMGKDVPPSGTELQEPLAGGLDEFSNEVQEGSLIA